MEAAKSDPRQPQRIEWRRAWRALRRVIENPDRTEEVFELIDAVSGPSFDRWYARFKQRPESAQLLQARPSALDALQDERLRSLPAGTLGRAYADKMARQRLTADGLVEASGGAGEHVPPPDRPDDPDRDFFGDRMRDTHDLWHIVTGYGMDDAGEAALVAFSHGQSRMLGFGVLALAALVIAPKTWNLEYERYLLRAWRRGRRARPFDAVPWEKWLELPLEEVRQRLDIEPPEIAHPGGILEARLTLPDRA